MICNHTNKTYDCHLGRTTIFKCDDCRGYVTGEQVPNHISKEQVPKYLKLKYGYEKHPKKLPL